MNIINKLFKKNNLLNILHGGTVYRLCRSLLSYDNILFCIDWVKIIVMNIKSKKITIIIIFFIY